MKRWNSLQRLARKFADPGNIPDEVLQNQVGRIRERLDTGTDIEGRRFVGSGGGDRPLSKASMFLDDAVVVTNGSGASLQLPEKSAIILNYQNNLRKFWGFSSEDRRLVLDDVAKKLGEK